MLELRTPVTQEEWGKRYILEPFKVCTSADPHAFPRVPILPQTVHAINDAAIRRLSTRSKATISQTTRNEVIVALASGLNLERALEKVENDQIRAANAAKLNRNKGEENLRNAEAARIRLMVSFLTKKNGGGLGIGGGPATSL